MKSIEEIKPIVESLIFVAEEPISLRKLTDIIEDANSDLIQEAIAQLKTITMCMAVHSRLKKLPVVINFYKT